MLRLKTGDLRDKMKTWPRNPGGSWAEREIAENPVGHYILFLKDQFIHVN
jgi:hypothetical protein